MLIKGFRFLAGLLFIHLGSISIGNSQTQTPFSGVSQNTPSIHAFTNATIVTAPGKIITNGILVERDGLISVVGPGAAIPQDAIVHDCSGKWIFPGFIDAWSDYGVPLAPGKSRDNAGPEYNNNAAGSHSWNQAVKPEFRVDAVFKSDASKAEGLRKAGFTLVNSVPNDGIFRGTSSLILLDGRETNESILKNQSALCLSWDKGTSTQEYPSSLIGTIALIRQTFLDADWYKEAMASFEKNPNQPKPDVNRSLEILSALLSDKTPLFFDGGDPMNILRLHDIANEFKKKFIIRTNGNEYTILTQLANIRPQLIVPLTFTKPWNLNDPADAHEISMNQLNEWFFDPKNAKLLSDEDISFSLTASGLKSPGDFLPALGKALAENLYPDKALEALTVTPAEFLGISSQAGTLDKGKLANFIICSGDIFKYNDAEIIETWVSGKSFSNFPGIEKDRRGKYSTENFTLLLSGKMSAPTAKVVQGADSLSGDFQFTPGGFVFSWKTKAGDKYRASGIFVNDGMEGNIEDLYGNIRVFNTQRMFVEPSYQGDKNLFLKKNKTFETYVNHPMMLYAQYDSAASSPIPILIQNARVWTNTEKGIIEKANIFIRNGKIETISENSIAISMGTTIIDATGKQVTPGIIDEHSHIAISGGVNEGAHRVSAEVRIGDAINPFDMNIYRQLSGGVTCSQLLHGSANPIGGQSAIVKLKYGSTPSKMKVEYAPGFIKFALGENVKQSNWGDKFNIRYPQTRMGVEQTFRDAFQSAKDYKKEWDRWLTFGEANGLIPPRKNLQCETMLEILDNKRFITCHSYVQSEIMMLVSVSTSMGFKVNTFTHVLEGYKVAAQLKLNGINASTFSDWWAYKYEVIDAIPYNAALMNEAGVNVCINSDDAEMGRRLNQEAAKSVMYGGMSEQDALKMVTLNPAKALHLDDHMGSIKVGMDADLVIWNDNPLSVYASPDYTIVDGCVYFDKANDLRVRQKISEWKSFLIKKMMTDDSEKQKFVPSIKEREYSCGDVHGF